MGEGDIFVGVMLAGLLLPWTLLKLYALRRLPAAERAALGGGDYAAAVARKASRLRSERWGAQLSVGNLVFVALCYALVNAGASALYTLPLVTEPHDVLGVASGATREEIKAAYRRLSLLLHPDKAGPDPEIAKRFLEVTRANAILTDPVSRDNYERYGNPDGYNGMKISFGLPAWAMNADNDHDSGVLVALLALAVAVGIPLLLLRYLQPSTREQARTKAKERFFVECYSSGKELSELEVLELCALAAIDLPAVARHLITPAVALAIEQLHENLPKSLKKKLDEVDGDGATSRASWISALLHAHVNRTPFAAKDDVTACMEAITAELPFLVDALATMSIQASIAKKTGTAKMESVLRALPRLVQALPIDTTSCPARVAELMQLPHVTSEIARLLLTDQPASSLTDVDAKSTGKGAGARKRKAKATTVGCGSGTAGRGAGSGSGEAALDNSEGEWVKVAPVVQLGMMRGLCAAPSEVVSAALLGYGLSEGQTADTLAFVRAFPDTSVRVEAEVLDEERIECGDMVHIRVFLTATRQASTVPRSDQGAPLAHAPFVPTPVPESFVIQVTFIEMEFCILCLHSCLLTVISYVLLLVYTVWTIRERT